MAEKGAKSQSTDKNASSVKAKPTETQSTAKKGTNTKSTTTKQTTAKSTADDKSVTKSKQQSAKPVAKEQKADKPAQKATASKSASVETKAETPVSKTAATQKSAEAKPSKAKAADTSVKSSAAEGKKATQKETSKTSVKQETAAKTEKSNEKASPKTSAKAVTEDNAAKKSSAAKNDKKPAEDKKTVITETKTEIKPEKAAGETVAKSKKAVKPDKENTPEKPQKDSSKSDKEGAGKAKLKKKPLAIIIGAVAIVVLVALLVGIILGAKSCNNDKGQAEALLFEYTSTQTVGFSGKVVGTTERVKPVAEMSNGGLPDYPKYGYTLGNVLGTTDDKVAARNALIYESSYLTATGTWNGGAGQYTWMDKDGYLYSGTTANPVPTLDSQNNHRQLYKHTASVGLYYGDVADDEPGIVKELTFRPRGYTRGYNVTGVYAPAGEVIKIQISEEDMNATGGIEVHIGQALYNGKANNIWTAKNQMQRFPVILNTMRVTKDTATLEDGVYTAYVGSFVGGPIYIRNKTVRFSVTVSGGVRYSHFILGSTTKEEFEENAKSSAPYFDMEVWSYGVLHSGPKFYSNGFTYEDIYKAAVLWEKVSIVSTTNSLQGIVFLYDPFVAAGAAVAFPGQGSVNCPAGWMRDSLNYKGLIKSGSWGNFHEYHHNFQGYGVGNGGEVTNNGMNLVSYALFTEISAARGIGSFGAAGLGGWNSYTSATWALEEVLKIARADENPSNGNQGLALYATLLHNFGADNYIKAKVAQQRGGFGQSYAGYLRAWQNVTHNDMSYYFNDILGANLSDTFKVQGYSMFVPVASVYQTGRSYMYDGEKKYFQTMQPYVIPYGEDFTVDLNLYDNSDGMYRGGSIKLPEGFSYTIKNITQPEHGRITEVGDKLYTFTPDTNMTSGKIIVTLGITKNDGAFKVDDVDLVLEFKQTHEKTKTVLERTTYSYTADNMYADAVEAYENGYANYESKVDKNHSNPVQNCNTDIWLYPDTADYKDSPYVVKENTIEELRGKLYFENEGKYRIYLRGRTNCAVYYSLDGGKTYALGATIKDCPSSDSAYFRPNDENTYFDVTLAADSWVYFKEILIVQKTPMISYIGLGMSKWQEPMFTMQDVLDEKGNVIGTKYFNYLGVEVSEEVANKAEPIPPVVTKGSQPYVNAFRPSYESATSEFESDYFYKRDYGVDYSEYTLANKEQTVIYHNYSAPPIGWGWGSFPLENLTDGNRNTFIHTSGGVSESSPLELVLDMGEVQKANRMTIYSQNRPNGDWKLAKAFTLYGSLDGNDFFTIGEFTDVPRSGATVSVGFEETEFRYYKIVITQSYSGHIIIGEIEFINTFELKDGTRYSADDDRITLRGKWDFVALATMYGHNYIGHRNSTMEFDMEGTGFVLLSAQGYGRNFEVYVDGKLVESRSQYGYKKDAVVHVKSYVRFNGTVIGTEADEILNEKSTVIPSFVATNLSEGKHKVVIKCTGEAAIGAVAVFS